MTVKHFLLAFLNCNCQMVQGSSDSRPDKSVVSPRLSTDTVQATLPPPARNLSRDDLASRHSNITQISARSRAHENVSAESSMLESVYLKTIQ